MLVVAGRMMAFSPKKLVQPYSEPDPCIFVEMSIKDLIIDEMFRFARSMLDDDENARLEVLPFVVGVAVTILQMPGQSEDDAIARAGNKLQTL
ncbi:hypothetical protein RHMOL_Rhmol09G0137200 [Rhododendron molle]|uniref:Uncharacterized protein n=1 Tax=Rhododendron molle TaxID=49168 RepID=A0ACC0MD97_RHOML|nr:hypothetical protein RHMOL_Rhmol09G0137200 [Rhododendron molle]